MRDLFLHTRANKHVQMDALDKYMFGEACHPAFDIALRIENYTGVGTNKLTKGSSSSALVSGGSAVPRHGTWYGSEWIVRGTAVSTVKWSKCITMRTVLLVVVVVVDSSSISSSK